MGLFVILGANLLNQYERIDLGIGCQFVDTGVCPHPTGGRERESEGSISSIGLFLFMDEFENLDYDAGSYLRDSNYGQYVLC